MGGSARGRLEQAGDEDWFRFRTTAAQTPVGAYTVSEGASVVVLHTADGTVAGENTESDGNYPITAEVPAGTHYLRVTGWGKLEYTLTLEIVSDDHGDTRETATELAVGGSARGRLELVGDEDWFRFRTTTASTLITAYTASDADTEGELYVTGGATVSDDNSGYHRNFAIEASVPAGTHYLRVRGAGVRDYTLKLVVRGLPPTPTEYVWIPAGRFVMGTPEKYGGEREVRITQGFWMGKYEVTQTEWEAVMGVNPSRFWGCGRCPVERVSWEQVQEFLERLNSLESASGRVYRLPTGAEWEYAARAGTTGARYGELDEIAWWRDNSDGKTHPVGQKRANAWGLHDMLGNVWEFTADWHGGNYPLGPLTDPQGPSTGDSKEGRGGAYYSEEYSVTAWRRYYAGLTNGSQHTGFRLVRTE